LSTLKVFEIFSVVFIINFYFYSIQFIEHTVYGVNPFKFIEACFMAPDMSYLDVGSETA
jgi:hypothetical protein